MDLNKIKKDLYKLNPKAIFRLINLDGILYTTIYGDASKGLTFIRFKVPLNEVGEVVWMPEMDAKLLIRYIQN